MFVKGLNCMGLAVSPRFLGVRREESVGLKRTLSPTHVLKPRESLGFALPLVHPVEGLASTMGSGGVGSPPARLEAAGGSVFVLPPLFSRVSVLVNPSIGMYADSSPLPVLFSGPEPADELLAEGLVSEEPTLHCRLW